ncbi:hypothetical protein ACS0TY_007566 [Phlomoides rotata]
MTRICQRKAEVVLVVEEIIYEIVFMLSVVLNRYRNTDQSSGLNVEHLCRYTMADRIPQQIEHMSELVEMSDTDYFDNLRVNRSAFNRLCYLLRHIGGLVDGNMDSCTPDQGLKQLRNRNDKGRRGRSVREEQVLSEAMKKIVREGWRTENGFKIGYLNLLSTYMKQEFPNTDLNPEPHITSRITKDPNARIMRSKSWPLYEDWCEIFGQSRATGEASVTVSHLRATTPPPSFSANINVDSASYKVGDETQDESQSPSGYA